MCHDIDSIGEVNLISDHRQFMKCKFASACKHFKIDSYTCNNIDEANNYCGCYRKFRNQYQDKNNNNLTTFYFVD